MDCDVVQAALALTGLFQEEWTLPSPVPRTPPCTPPCTPPSMSCDESPLVPSPPPATPLPTFHATPPGAPRKPRVYDPRSPLDNLPRDLSGALLPDLRGTGYDDNYVRTTWDRTIGLMREYLAVVLHEVYGVPVRVFSCLIEERGRPHTSPLWVCFEWTPCTTPAHPCTAPGQEAVQLWAFLELHPPASLPGPNQELTKNRRRNYIEWLARSERTHRDWERVTHYGRYVNDVDSDLVEALHASRPLRVFFDMYLSLPL